jgi:transposase-like protein
VSGGAISRASSQALRLCCENRVDVRKSSKIFSGTIDGDFKWRHFQGEVILWAVRWYCRYGVSYRDLEQMIGERGVPVYHSTIYRWVQKHAPEIEKWLRWHWRRPQSTSWRVDETYVKVRGRPKANVPQNSCAGRSNI